MGSRARWFKLGTEPGCDVYEKAIKKKWQHRREPLMVSTQRAAPPNAGTRTAALLGRLWRSSPPLTVVGLLMLVVAVPSLVGVFVDPRIITGAPAWLKPFKFAISTAIYSLTLAWIFGFLSDWPRVRRVVGWTTAIVFVLEVTIIDLQAWRGTTS